MDIGIVYDNCINVTQVCITVIEMWQLGGVARNNIYRLVTWVGTKNKLQMSLIRIS